MWQKVKKNTFSLKWVVFYASNTKNDQSKKSNKLAHTTFMQHFRHVAAIIKMSEFSMKSYAQLFYFIF